VSAQVPADRILRRAQASGSGVAGRNEQGQRRGLNRVTGGGTNTGEIRFGAVAGAGRPAVTGGFSAGRYGRRAGPARKSFGVVQGDRDRDSGRGQQDGGQQHLPRDEARLLAMP
jgi:hypothetical protein